MRARLIIKPIDGAIRDGSPVDRSGIVTPPGTVIASRTEDIIVLYIPGHHYWSGRGRQGYGGADYEVWRVVPWAEGKLALLGDTEVMAERILSFPVRRPKP